MSFHVWSFKKSNSNSNSNSKSNSNSNSKKRKEKKEKKEKIDEEKLKQDLYKTELCQAFEETGYCKYGKRCQFAHGIEELRPIQHHPKYKTRLCKSFHGKGFCKYGKRCRFIHYDLSFIHPFFFPKTKRLPIFSEITNIEMNSK
ncbi:protein tis11 [Anaeramoeba ignava]|uniref:Protein tis11 n=1 Tax=Anaeramoeba ignava TaxID=1746090 RepID=A0A9Q0LE61_ANAIG|nr:protein tis11 [Anaeramoeba ignava]